jgi:hypothetical protein
MNKYIIEEKRLEELLKAEHRLLALEGAGVDNWSYYGDHYDDYFDYIGDDIISEREKEELYTDELIEILVFDDMKKFDRLKDDEVENIIVAIKEKPELNTEITLPLAIQEESQLNTEITLPLAIKKYQDINKQFEEIQETIKEIIADHFYEETAAINVQENKSIKLYFVIHNILYYINCYITTIDSTYGTPAHVYFATDFMIENIGIDNKIKIQDIFN